MAATEKKPSYEEARDELAEIVESLADGSATLEESLKLWERGEELAKIFQEWVDGAKKKIDASKKAAEYWRQHFHTLIYFRLVKIQLSTASSVKKASAL